MTNFTRLQNLNSAHTSSFAHQTASPPHCNLLHQLLVFINQ
jgi:hypothetical protein